MIIGAGLAGLSAGIYLQQNGVQTEIFEISGQAGGMCAAWERGGYRFDGCIHWMVGTKPGTAFNRLYREVDALLEDTPIYYPGTLCVEYNATLYEIPLQLEPFKEFMLKLSPQDAEAIKALCGDLALFMNSEMPAGMPADFAELLHFMRHSTGFAKLSGRYAGMPMQEYAQRFKSPILRSIISGIMSAGEASPKFSAFTLFMNLATRMSRDAGYPIGGALGIAQRMQAKYLSLGGRLHLRTRVEQILVENGRAVGVAAKGEFYQADAVIAACDANSTLTRLLGGSYRHPQLEQLLQSADLFTPLIMLSFGLNRRLNLPYDIEYECPEGIETAPGFTAARFALRSFEFDPSTAPEGCSSVMVRIDTKLDFWQSLRQQSVEEYRRQKERLAARAIEALNRRIPGFQEAVAVCDVATPATYIRYADLYKASWQGFVPTPKTIPVNIKTAVEGVKGLVLAGQWVTKGGGICAVVLSGRDAARTILKHKI